MDLKSLLEHSLLTKTASNEYTLQAGDDFTEAAILLEGLGWVPKSHVAGEGIRTVVYAPVGIPDAYERLKAGYTILYKTKVYEGVGGKTIEVRPTSNKTFGWYVQFELYHIDDKGHAHFLKRGYLNRQEVAEVFHDSMIYEILPDQREDLEDEPAQPAGENSDDTTD